MKRALVLALLAIFTVGQMAALAAPAISVQPVQGAAGSSIVISGSGFRPNDTILVGWDPGQQDQAFFGNLNADAQGNFSTRATVPGNAASGPHLVLAQGPGAQAQAPFIVTSTQNALPPATSRPAAPAATPGGLSVGLIVVVVLGILAGLFEILRRLGFFSTPVPDQVPCPPEVIEAETAMCDAFFNQIQADLKALAAEAAHIAAAETALNGAIDTYNADQVVFAAAVLGFAANVAGFTANLNDASVPYKGPDYTGLTQTEASLHNQEQGLKDREARLSGRADALSAAYATYLNHFNKMKAKLAAFPPKPFKCIDCKKVKDLDPQPAGAPKIHPINPVGAGIPGGGIPAVPPLSALAGAGGGHGGPGGPGGPDHEKKTEWASLPIRLIDDDGKPMAGLGYWILNKEWGAGNPWPNGWFQSSVLDHTGRARNEHVPRGRYQVGFYGIDASEWGPEGAARSSTAGRSGEAYVVQDGDWLLRIAVDVGGFRTDMPLRLANPHLEQACGDNPNVLPPGLELQIPDYMDKSEPAFTDRENVYTVAVLRTNSFRLTFEDSDGQPLRGWTAELRLSNQHWRGLKTDDRGQLTVSPVTDMYGVGWANVVLTPPPDAKGNVAESQTIELKVGSLSPITADVEGRKAVQKILSNLGFYNGPVAGDFELWDTRDAIRWFQDVAGLTGPAAADAMADEPTCLAMVEAQANRMAPPVSPEGSPT